MRLVLTLPLAFGLFASKAHVSELLLDYYRRGIEIHVQT